MHVLFVGGLAHGQTQHIDDNLTVVEFAGDPLLKAGAQRYEIHTWRWVDAAHGFDAVAVNSFVPLSEQEAQVQDALAEARKRV
jgi:hypothetical protein